MPRLGQGATDKEKTLLQSKGKATIKKGQSRRSEEEGKRDLPKDEPCSRVQMCRLSTNLSYRNKRARIG